jgi:hypothetical protein
VVLLLLAPHACTSSAPIAPAEAKALGPEAPGPPPAAAPPTYDELRAGIEARRAALAARRTGGDDVRAAARAELLTAVRELVPPWFGTPWDYSGTTEVPGEGEIACGYFVSTVLRDAGLRVDRVKLAQQASALIAKTFAGPDVTWFRTRDLEQVLALPEGSPQDLWIVGLDYHVGLLVEHEGQTSFCHSAARGEVLCEDPRTSEAFVSRVHALGPVLTDRAIDAWLDGALLPTALR